MRSTTLISLGAFLALLAAAAPAEAQRKGTKKPEPPKTEEPDENANAWSETEDKSAKSGTKPAGAADEASTKDMSRVEPPSEKWDIENVEEVPGRSYYFVGLRYRGNVIPHFLLGAFVDEGKTIFTNMVGAEFELRKNGFSLIPALTFQELGTGDVLFKQKNVKDIPGNYSVVNSSMKVIYASADLLWSTKLSKNVDFEYGAGFGIGAVFGGLQNDWVKEDSNGPLHADGNGKNYRRCAAVEAAGTGCNSKDHQNSSVDKVGGYKEKSWFDGGSKPVLFPWISVPQIGLRFKPIKNFVGRLGVGFALTGFWFGLNGQYGLEQKPPK
jgi:hypothetical protein